MTAIPNPRPTLADIDAEIQWFIRDCLLEDDYEGVDPLAERAIDSLALEQLLDHLEERYLILFDPEEITRPNLATVSRVAELVDARIAAVAGGRRSW
ncbi:MAG: hypothetical protein JWP14_2142 [Frankiales bacterium]|nr:hypothetical protein [Frankiales bacterium]